METGLKKLLNSIEIDIMDCEQNAFSIDDDRAFRYLKRTRNYIVDKLLEHEKQMIINAYDSGFDYGYDVRSMPCLMGGVDGDKYYEIIIKE